MTDPSDILRSALAGRYTLDRELGRGGMATVWLAHDVRHDRSVALKALHPDLSAGLGSDRFLREIRTTARLDHPHILALLDSGEATGSPAAPGASLLWYTMPYVEGESLRDRLRREGQLPVDQAVRIAAETADALDCAHEHGVVHRDIKPENILLSRGHARVADFGIARALEAAGSDLTATGLAVGTPAYMSPEQASGGAVDARSDVYALGCVLYEMLAGEPPFTGPTAQSVIAKRFAGEPTALRRLRAAVPELVEQAVRRALATVPADRFASAAEFGHALEAATPSGSWTPTTGTPTLVAAAPAVRSRRLRPPVLALTLAAGFLLGLGVLFGWLRNRDAGSTGEAGGVSRLAVLPFENQGAADDEYFADGLTDAVRGKLAMLPRLQVVARSSSASYKRTTKTPQEIGRELGVQYLLTGTVRWDKRAGRGRVQVSPELVQVSTASTKWQEPFDAALTDVFQVQADVATRVAEALGVALASGDRARLDARPTANLAAYDLYLRGKAYYDRSFDREDFRIARQMLERAVALDSAFALAWARLAEVRAAEYWFFYDRTESALAGAKSAAEQALRLRPDLPEGHLGLGYYWYWGKLDYDRALRELTAALAARPNDADLIFAIAAVRRRQGDWKGAVENFTRAVELDPRSQTNRLNLAETYWLLRDYPRALEQLDTIIALAPAWPAGYLLKTQALLASGLPLAAAREPLHDAATRLGFPPIARVVVQNLNIIEPTFLVTTDSAYRHDIESLELAGFPDTLGYYHLKSELYRFEHRRDLERAYLDSARVALEAKVREQPDEPGYHADLGLVYAYLGRADEANREAQVAVRLLPVARDAYRGGSMLTAAAMVESRTGRAGAAAEKLDSLLSIPSAVSRPLFRVDPAWSALREHPESRRLVEATR